MRICLSMLFLLSVLLSGTTAHAAVQYSFSNGAYNNVPIDPYFLDSGDDVGDFYSYGSPVGSSANTGFEENDTGLVFLTRDDTGNYGLVIVMDNPGSGGGNANLSITGLPTSGVTVAQYDDPGDSYTADWPNGTLTCGWNWVNCCTDGIALDMGQVTDFTLNLQFTFNSGMSQLKFFTFDVCSQTGGVLEYVLDETQTLSITAVESGSDHPDCNNNNLPDFCDLFNGTSQDCNGNDIPDECDIADGTSQDCNGNGIPDECDILNQTSLDCNANFVPDECEEDCNSNGVPDECDILNQTSLDCNANFVPDECETDCNGNGIPDDCDVADQTSPDCNGNGVPDECDIAAQTSPDCNGNGVPDECDIASGGSDDDNGNGVPDECEATVSAIELPISFSLEPVAPNPFNPSTVIRFSLPQTMEARLVVHDLQGREVRELAGGLMQRGQQQVRFDATGLPGGIYFAVLESGDLKASRKMLLLK